MEKIEECPECGSKKVSIWEWYEVWAEKEAYSGNIRNKRVILNEKTRTRWCYSCRKCGWESEEYGRE